MSHASLICQNYTLQVNAKQFATVAIAESVVLKTTHSIDNMLVKLLLNFQSNLLMPKYLFDNFRFVVVFVTMLSQISC